MVLLGLSWASLPALSMMVSLSMAPLVLRAQPSPLDLVTATGLVEADTEKPTEDQPPSDESKPPPPASSCVTVSGRTRYTMGYDHLVDVKNDCKKAVMCQVWTNVNPEKQAVSLEVGESTTVLTFRGSPAREFTPQTSCKYR